MFPDAVTIANKAGNVVGRADNGDTVTLVFSRLLDMPTLCSGASNSVTSLTGTVTWSLINGTGTANDTLAVTAAPTACTNGFRVGSIDLGSPGYNTSTTNIDFPSTTVVTLGASTTSIAVTLAGRKPNAAVGTVSSGAAATWTPDSAVTDRNGQNCGTNVAKTSATVQF